MTAKAWIVALLALWVGDVAVGGVAIACETGIGPTRVSEIYPTADRLPANLLRAYVYFTEPMDRVGMLSSIDLLDADGEVVPGVFLANRHDLFSPDGRRLTLIFDPGRVKTGLAARDRLGRALVVGRSYTLVVRQSALDAGGCRLVAEHRKRFTVVEQDDRMPDPATWGLELPSAGTTEPLIVDLDGSHDHVSLAYRIRVEGPDGEVVAGAIDLADHESQWRFTPKAAWRAVSYRLVIDPTLEDLAGNRPGRLFDQVAGSEEIDPSPIEVRFTLE